ncbi:MAG: CaiB/BaiF CoA transferase family protein [Ornithinimicrobium sp.]|uniref:CaiB/BaiF CoA transferase family protein n=1 Tax=Ornithinimicrobium sp. TaxID=1977084 RepID=UPI00185D39DC|nr:CoA transferase [Actinomycetota bacterium]
MSGALDGILVADFSRVLAGPLATMHLADLGATVIKVERPGAGDDTRSWGPPWSSTSSTYFDSVNRSKRSLTLDLSDEADRGLAHELARRADVLVENFRPGALDRFGLGYEQVRPDNRGVVYASVTGFGRTGGADLMGYDFLVQAVGGLMSVTGEAGGPPTKTGVAVVDVLTGKDLSIGVLAALVARGRTGQGCRVEVDLLSSLLAAMVNQGQSTLATGTAPGRMGNSHPSITPYETLRCGGGLVAVACGNDGQFARLAAALGRPGLAEDPRLATNAARVAHRADLVQILESLLAAHDSATWQRILTRVGVPAGRVGDLADAFALAESLGLHPWTDVGEPGAPCPQVRHPVQYGPALTVPPTAPPQLGEHDAQLRDWLHHPDAPVPPTPAHRIPSEEVPR